MPPALSFFSFPSRPLVHIHICIILNFFLPDDVRIASKFQIGLSLLFQKGIAGWLLYFKHVHGKIANWICYALDQCCINETPPPPPPHNPTLPHCTDCNGCKMASAVWEQQALFWVQKLFIHAQHACSVTLDQEHSSNGHDVVVRLTEH